MKLGLLLGDLLGSLVRRPATNHYPFEKEPAPLRLRGPIGWDRSKCTGCGVCVMDCPANALELFTFDKAARRFVLEYHIDRCAFCGQCSESCKQHALWMSHAQWELATESRPSLTIRYGLADDVRKVLESRAAPGG